VVKFPLARRMDRSRDVVPLVVLECGDERSKVEQPKLVACLPATIMGINSRCLCKII